MSNLLFEMTDELDAIPLVSELICNYGDIWQLGNHRIMCGDSTNKNDIDKLFGNIQIDMVLSDPPYGINIVNKNNKIGGENLAKNKIYKPIINDNNTDTAKYFYELIKDCSKIFLFGGNYFVDFLPFSSSWLIWDKQVTGNFADGEMIWTNTKTSLRIYKYLWNGMCRCERAERTHPTQKPVSLLENIIKDFAKENSIIFDGFLGSGSTLVACEKTKCKCYGIEIEPYYCDVVINRWQKMTGKKAIKIEIEGMENA